MPTSTPADVVGIGQCCWDILLDVNRYPEVDTKRELLSRAEQGGGPVATALVTLARLGVTCRFHGIVGDDDAANGIRQSLAVEDIDISEIRTEKKAPRKLPISWWNGKPAGAPFSGSGPVARNYVRRSLERTSWRGRRHCCSTG